MHVWKQALATLNSTGCYVPGPLIETSFTYLKAIFSEGLQGQAQRMMTLQYFKKFKLKELPPTEADLLDSIDRVYIGPYKINVLLEIVETLESRLQLDRSKAVRSIYFC